MQLTGFNISIHPLSGLLATNFFFSVVCISEKKSKVLISEHFSPNWNLQNTFLTDRGQRNKLPVPTVVQKADNFIQRINRYPVDKNVLQLINFIRWIATCPLDKVIRFLNNRGENDRCPSKSFIKRFERCTTKTMLTLGYVMLWLSVSVSSNATIVITWPDKSWFFLVIFCIGYWAVINRKTREAIYWKGLESWVPMLVSSKEYYYSVYSSRDDRPLSLGGHVESQA